MARPFKYDWDIWFGNARRFILLRGKHYKVSNSTMVQAIRNNAASRGIKVSIFDDNTSITVIINSRSKKPCRT